MKEQDNIITPELYDTHPEYAEAGLKVGDPIPEVELVDFVVTQEYLDAHPGAPEDVKVGDTIQIPNVVKKAIPVETPTQPSPEQAVAPATAPVPVKTFNGHAVISDGFREVEGRKFRHIKIADGTTYDLSEDEYQSKVVIS